MGYDYLGAALKIIKLIISLQYMKKVHNNLSILTVLSIVIFSLSINPLKAQTPKSKILKGNRIFDNGKHIAFTYMHCFKGCIYLAFRS